MQLPKVASNGQLHRGQCSAHAYGRLHFFTAGGLTFRLLELKKVLGFRDGLEVDKIFHENNGFGRSNAQKKPMRYINL